MKLYTEEQVIKAIQLSRTFAVHMKTEDIVILVSDKLTPIELPSDEEIAKMVGRGGCDYEGAKWMKDKILNQNK